MLRHTFIHLPRVGAVTEQELWQSGVTTWEAFLDASDLPARLRRRDAELRAHLLKSCARLDEADAVYFASCLPSREQWRLYADFRHRAAFLDIETTGLSSQSGRITMVGILDCQGYTAYVRDENLSDLPAALERYDLIVTYNGAQFDLPYIQWHFGQVFRQAAHIDLRFPLRRLGYRGGLKSIEAQLGAGRPVALEGLDGFDAVLLWRLWQRGDRGARDTLVRYNAEDVASLPVLADIAYNRLASELPVPCRPIGLRSRPEIDLPYDPGAVRRVRSLRGLPVVSRGRFV